MTGKVLFLKISSTYPEFAPHLSRSPMVGKGLIPTSTQRTKCRNGAPLRAPRLSPRDLLLSTSKALCNETPKPLDSFDGQLFFFWQRAFPLSIRHIRTLRRVVLTWIIFRARFAFLSGKMTGVMAHTSVCSPQRRKPLSTRGARRCRLEPRGGPWSRARESARLGVQKVLKRRLLARQATC